MDLGEQSAAFESEWRTEGCQVLKHDAAVVVFLDEPGSEAGFGSGKPDRFLKERRFLLVQPQAQPDRQGGAADPAWLAQATFAR